MNHHALLHAGHNSKIIHIQNWIEDNERVRLAAARADVIILQRVLLDESAAIGARWVAQGKRVLVSFDDAYHLIGSENAAFKFWGKGEVEVNTVGNKWTRKLPKHPVDQFLGNLQHISGGITPGKVLADDYRVYAPMVHLPNYLETHRYRGLRAVKGIKRTIGWGGSLSHLTSFSHSGTQEALREFLRHHDLQFQLVGDKRLIPQLKLPEGKLWFRNYVMLFDWPQVLTSFDIGLAPLAMPYDQRRSRLKVMEYIALGIPFVATKSMVYEDFFDCASGIFVDQGGLTVCDKPNIQGWLDALMLLNNNYQDYRAIAEKEKERYHSVYDSANNAKIIAEKIIG